MQTKQQKREKAIQSFSNSLNFYTNAGIKEILAVMLAVEESAITPKILKNADENEIRAFQKAKIKATEQNLSNTQANFDNPRDYRDRQKAKKHRSSSSGKARKNRNNNYQGV